MKKQKPRRGLTEQRILQVGLFGMGPLRIPAEEMLTPFNAAKAEMYEAFGEQRVGQLQTVVTLPIAQAHTFVKVANPWPIWQGGLIVYYETRALETTEAHSQLPDRLELDELLVCVDSVAYIDKLHHARSTMGPIDDYHQNQANFRAAAVKNLSSQQAWSDAMFVLFLSSLVKAAQRYREQNIVALACHAGTPLLRGNLNRSEVRRQIGLGESVLKHVARGNDKAHVMKI